MGFRAAPFAILALALAGCVTGQAGPPGGLSEPHVERLGQYLYMVPVARDKRGCVVYLVESPFRRNDRSLYWRVGKGNSTTDPTAVRCV